MGSGALGSGQGRGRAMCATDVRAPHCAPGRPARRIRTDEDLPTARPRPDGRLPRATERNTSRACQFTRASALRRSLAVAAALPLLAVALTACGYGSDAAKDDTGRPRSPRGAKKLSAGHREDRLLPEPHPRHRAGRRPGGPLRRRSWAARRLRSSTFNAGPVRDRGAERRCDRHRLDRPLPGHQRLHPVPAARTCGSSAARRPAA